MVTMTTRLRLVIEDPRQLLSGCVTDYAVEQLRLNGNHPATVVVPGLDRYAYPTGRCMGILVVPALDQLDDITTDLVFLIERRLWRARRLRRMVSPPPLRRISLEKRLWLRPGTRSTGRS
jgi:hypothetical protein